MFTYQEWERVETLYTELQPAERKAWLMLGERILKGQKAYGPFEPSTERRDLRKERAEELADAEVYDVFERLVKLERG